MATITRENLGKLNDKLVVTLAKEDYYPSFEKSLKTYAHNANIPGFRKGKVPAGYIKKIYGKGILGEELSRAVDKELNKYITEEKLPLLVQPIPVEDANNELHFDLNTPKEYTFSFEVGLEPEFTIDPKSIKVKKYKIAVSDEAVKEEEDRLELRHGKYSEPETLGEDDDVLNVELKETDKDGKPVENGATKSTSILLKNFTPEVRKQLEGQKKDFKLVIELKKAFAGKELENILAHLGFEANDKEAAGKFFELHLLKLGRIQRPELNEDFFKKVYPDKENIKTEADLLAEVKKELAAYLDQQSENQVHDQIYHALIDHTPIDLPEDFLKRWLKVSNEGKKTEEEIEKSLPEFEKQLKWGIIVSKLSKANDIKVEKEDLKQYARQQVLSYLGGQVDLSGDLSWIESYADKVLQDKKFVDQAYAQIQASKLFTALASQVTTEEEPISEKDFADKVASHVHEH